VTDKTKRKERGLMKKLNTAELNLLNHALDSGFPKVYSRDELLKYAEEQGIIDLDDVENTMRKQQKQNILNNHTFKIYHGHDNRWYTYLPDDSKPNGRRKVVKTEESDLENLIVSHYKNQSEERKLEQITLRTLYPKWLDYKRLHTTASNYIRRIEVDWKKFYANTPIIDKPIKHLTKLDLDIWVHESIKNFKLTKTAYYNMSIIFRQGLDYAIELGIIKENPLSEVKIDGKRVFRKVKKKSSETQVFFPKELEQIFPMAWSDFYNRVKQFQLSPLAFLFMFQTGLRVSEVCTLRYEDIEREDYLHVQRMSRRETKEVVEHTKTEYGDRYLLLTPTAKDIISHAKKRQEELGVDSNGYIFSIIDDLPLPQQPLLRLYEKYCRNAGIIHKSSHKARKTYISSLIDKQVNINTIREMVGHSDERTTLGNYCFDRSTEQEKLEQIEKALKFA
jgi:integrase